MIFRTRFTSNGVCAFFEAVDGVHKRGPCCRADADIQIATHRRACRIVHAWLFCRIVQAGSAYGVRAIFQHVEHIPRDAICRHDGVHGAEVQVGNIVDRARIVDVVGGDLRGVRRSRRLGVRYLPAEVAGLQLAACGILCRVENLLAEVLVPDRRMKVVPLRVLWIGGRMQRMEAHMTEPAGHTDEIRRLDERGVRKILLQIPCLCIKLRIFEPPQADDASRIPHRPGHVFAPTGIEPQPILVRRGCRCAVRIVDDPEALEPFAAIARVNCLQQVDSSVRTHSQNPPQRLIADDVSLRVRIATGPHVPCVASLALQRRKACIARRITVLFAMRAGAITAACFYGDLGNARRHTEKNEEENCRTLRHRTPLSVQRLSLRPGTDARL